MTLHTEVAEVEAKLLLAADLLKRRDRLTTEIQAVEERVRVATTALQSLHARLLTGYGFASFWGSSAIQNLPEGKEWAGFAAHSHNGYLDTALGMGVPGLLLLILVLVILPLRNFQQADEGGNNGPLAMMLLRVWLFGLYLSVMESFFLDRSDPLWFTFLLAVFGLHYLARFRAVV